MPQTILIAGAGFAGLMAALSAARLREEKGVSPEDLVITVIAPQPDLVIRPRLYEPNPETMTAPLADLFAATDIRFEAGRVDAIDGRNSAVTVARADGTSSTMPFDRLVIATGSTGFQPPIPGLSEYGHSVNDLTEAMALDRHLAALGLRPESLARNTVVVGGGGFTGIEVATEMPERLKSYLGKDARTRIVVVERSNSVAPDMGAEPRPYIEQSLAAHGIETRIGESIAAVDAGGVTLDSGERIEAQTVVWSAGMRASPLTAALDVERDALGRIVSAPDLRVPGFPAIFAAGDTVKVAADADGHFALMSCQHARRLGAFAGHNAAADLLGEPALPYDQPNYVVCLDLGGDDAIFTRGWSPRAVEMTGTAAKRTKMEINSVWIYPPAADKAAAFQNAFEARTVNY